MAYLMGYTSGSTYVMGRSDFSPSALSFLSVPASVRRGSSYTISMFGVGTNLANISATLGGIPVTVTSTDGSTVGITIPANHPLKHSNQGYPLVVTVSGVGAVTSALIPFLPPVGWAFVDLISPLPSTDQNSLTFNMVNGSGAAVNAVTGDQAVYQDAGGARVSPDGSYGWNVNNTPPTGPLTFQAYIIEADGTIGQTATKTITYQSGADTTPDAFTLTAATNSPLEQWVVSNAITVQNVDPGLDVPVTITGGEYQVSTNNGGTWGAFTSANTNVQLNYQIRVRVFTSDQYADPRTVTLTVGGVSAGFTATTASDPALAPSISITATMLKYTGGGVDGTVYDGAMVRIVAALNNVSSSLINVERQNGSGWTFFSGSSSSAAQQSASFRASVSAFANGTSLTLRGYIDTPSGRIYSDTVTFTVQNPPVLTLSAPVGAQATTFNAVANFSKDVTGVNDSSFTVSSGTIVGVAPAPGSQRQYVIVIEPPANSVGNIQLGVSSSAVIVDSVGNWPVQSFGNFPISVVPPQPITIAYDTTQVVTNPQILSIGGDNIIQPGETVTIAVQDIALANIDQVVLAGNAGEYAIPFNGSAQVTIPTFIPAGTYTLKLREFA